MKDELISRNAAIEAMKQLEKKDIESYGCKIPEGFDATEAIEELGKLPTLFLKQYCKECKFFEYDRVLNVDGIPLIVAHEICSKWGGGSKTSENGYCFLFEPKQTATKEGGGDE